MEGPSDDAWRASLNSRMEQVRGGVADVKVVVMESMIPGQRMLVTAPPQLVSLFTSNPDGSAIVMLGRQGHNVATYGVEVRLEKMVMKPVVPGIHPEGTADITLVAVRMCELIELFEAAVPGQWLGRPGRARWLPLESLDGQNGTIDAELISRSQELETRVGEWIDLVRSTRKEQRNGQLASVLEDLGPIPDAQHPSRHNAHAHHERANPTEVF